MKNIAIYGAGGLGREVACLINKINQETPTWCIKGFYDDGITKGTRISHFGKVLGNIDDLNSVNNTIGIFIAIGNPNIIEKMSKRCQKEAKEYMPDKIMKTLIIEIEK